MTASVIPSAHASHTHEYLPSSGRSTTSTHCLVALSTSTLWGCFTPGRSKGQAGLQRRPSAMEDEEVHLTPHDWLQLSGLPGVVLYLLPDVQSDRLRTLVFLLWLGNMRELGRLALTCHALLPALGVWCEGCCTIRLPTLRTARTSTVPMRIPDLLRFGDNLYCWTCA